MSRVPDAAVESWAGPLVNLLNRWFEFHQEGMNRLLRGLCRTLLDFGCSQVIDWIYGRRDLDLRDEVESAALQAILQTLERNYSFDPEFDPLTPDQHVELRDLRRRLAQAVQDRLDAKSGTPKKTIKINGEPLSEAQRKIWVALDRKVMTLKHLANGGIGRRFDESHLYRDHLKPMKETDPPEVKNCRIAGGYFRPDALPCLG